MSKKQERLLILVLTAGFLATVLIAAWLPVSAVQYIRLRIVEYDWLTTTQVSSAQRVTAAMGGLIATLTLARLLWFPVASALQAVWGTTLFVLSSVCLSLVVFNLWASSLLNSMSGWSLQMKILIIMLVIGGMGLLGVFVTYYHFIRNTTTDFSIGRNIASPVGAGTGYGCFSALWHCCPPIWDGGLGETVMTIIAMGCVLTAIAALSLRWASPVGETMGGVLLAMIYPWHSVFWFIQMLFAGAFFTWLARRTGNVFAPAIAASTALIVHQTLPFLGWTGVAISCVFIAFFLLCSHKEIHWMRETLR